MEVRKIALGVLVTVACAAPVLTRPAAATMVIPGHNSTVLAQGFECDFGDDSFYSYGGYARWTSQHSSHSNGWSFNFGEATDQCSGNMAGLRLEATGLPARTFGVDWKLDNASGSEAIQLFVSDSSGTFEAEDFNAHYIIANPVIAAQYGFTSTSLGNGVTRFFYNYLNDYYGVKGNKWNNIYIYDSDMCGDTETLTNVNVNGLSVGHGITPNFKVLPQIDCTPEYDVYGSS
jgi:hypothetical protein